MKIFFLFIVTIFLFSGCSTRTVTPQYQEIQTPQIEEVPPPEDNRWVREVLYQKYEEWDSAPYKRGGRSKKGVDCSSFVQIVYKDGFGVELPRTTGEQALQGYDIKKNALQVGDLIFFKTGTKSKHAGIIIEEGKFLHASTDTGVTISQLNNPYWKNRYWTSRRVLPLLP
jgi:lipoprotein Spr/probable lipoprotein NlpC